MARQESQREDLLAEAVALVERVELRLPDFPDSVVVGFRRDGTASFFFGSDLVLQFNTQNEFRRGYWSGQLLKADRGALITMQRMRTDAEVVLSSRSLSIDETKNFLDAASQLLHVLWEGIRDCRVELIGQVPADSNVLGRVAAWLESNPSDAIRIAARPHVRS